MQMPCGTDSVHAVCNDDSVVFGSVKKNRTEAFAPLNLLHIRFYMLRIFGQRHSTRRPENVFGGEFFYATFAEFPDQFLSYCLPARQGQERQGGIAVALLH